MLMAGSPGREAISEKTTNDTANMMGTIPSTRRTAYGPLVKKAADVPIRTTSPKVQLTGGRSTKAQTMVSANPATASGPAGSRLVVATMAPTITPRTRMANDHASRSDAASDDPMAARAATTTTERPGLPLIIRTVGFAP